MASNADQPAGKPLLSVRKSAAYLGISTGAVYGLINSGQIEHYRLGPDKGAIRISTEVLDAYLESCKVATSPQAMPSTKPASGTLAAPSRLRKYGFKGLKAAQEAAAASEQRARQPA